MFDFFKRQWFVIALLGAAVLGYLLPGGGAFLRSYHVLTVGLVLSFFLTGLTLDARLIPQALNSFRAPAAALVSALIIYPVVAWLIATPLLPYEFVIGCYIIAVGPVSVSSGTILTALARGNVPLSVLFCILTHFGAIFTIPIVLDSLVGGGSEIELPIFSMLGGLVLKVLVPLAAGLLARPYSTGIIQRCSPGISRFQTLVILLMVYTAVSSSAESIRQLDTLLVRVILVIVGIYHVMLLINIGLARWLKFTREDRIAFTIHGTQKTLGVSFIVWTGFFAAAYPAAFIPAILCHLIQMLAAPFLVEYYNKKRSRE
jgi:sodium/bile acid cotransporter 7